jgi:hypothetical protein
LAVGSYSRPCVVHKDFKIIVHVPASALSSTPLPFLNRFEKYPISLEQALDQKIRKAQWEEVCISFPFLLRHLSYSIQRSLLRMKTNSQKLYPFMKSSKMVAMTWWSNYIVNTHLVVCCIVTKVILILCFTSYFDPKYLWPSSKRNSSKLASFVCWAKFAATQPNSWNSSSLQIVSLHLSLLISFINPCIWLVSSHAALRDQLQQRKGAHENKPENDPENDAENDLEPKKDAMEPKEAEEDIEEANEEQVADKKTPVFDFQYYIFLVQILLKYYWYIPYILVMKKKKLIQ